MPSLGIDVTHLDRFDADTRRFRDYLKRVPIITILEQIVKLFEQLNRLISNNHIHGDIRDTNVMLSKEGKITIIDFDLLEPLNDFLDNYGFNMGFYSNPPETLFYSLLPTINSDEIDAFTDRSLLAAIPMTDKYTVGFRI
jgi:serine/threonine protein kinase